MDDSREGEKRARGGWRGWIQREGASAREDKGGERGQTVEGSSGFYILVRWDLAFTSEVIGHRQGRLGHCEVEGGGGDISQL